MNKRLKKGISSILILSLILSIFCITGFASNTLTQNVALYEGGRIDITGVISGGTGLQVTCAVSEVGNPLNIVYINQTVSTTNGTYLFRFTLPAANKGKTLDFKIGGTDATMIKKTLTIPNFPININSVENNSVRVGIDVYQMESTYYTANNVVDSLKQGGNTIYYKIGDRWYDIMNTNAKSAAWLVPTNAVNTTTVSAWLLDMWYPRGGFGTMKFDPLPL